MLDLRFTVVALLIYLASQNMIKAFVNDAPAATVSDGCAKKSLGDTLYNKNPVIPKKKWIETPSVAEIANNYYQAFSRVIHLKYLKEQLEGQPTFLKFDATRGELDFNIQLDILSDTVYIEGEVALHGIKQLRVFARQIIASRGSQLDVSTPDWNQEFARRVVFGVDGIDGKHGFDGPIVKLYADVIHGSFDVITNGANGQKGQDGGDGQRARNSGKTESDIPESSCEALSEFKCDKAPIPGVVGEKGPKGGQGGNAGHPGNGGNAGHIVLRYQRLEGKVELESCRGTGAGPAKNGIGGLGGAGGKGGRGRQCFVSSLDRGFCVSHSLVDRASSGPPGERGDPGTTPNTPGTDGTVDQAAIRTGALDLNSKKDYPIRLLRAIFRRAEDFLLANSKDESGKAALNFIITVTRGQGGLRSLRRAAKRKLVFVGKKGYDIFGRNKLFVPRLKWDALKDHAEKIKEAAKTVEKAYNDVKSTVEKNENFAEVARKLSKTAGLQVEAEKKRLVEARLIARSEKRLYVKSIKVLEEQMQSILKLVKEMLPTVYKKAKFNANDMLAVLQGITGFVSGAISKDPGAFLGAAVGIASDLSGKACLGSFNWNLEAIKRSLTFGEKYKPLKQSSDLNFDDFDVSAVPEVMQNNLDMNKEKLAAQLVCMLDVASRPQDVAELKQHIESFFSSGSARIDLIAKVLDLDNDIGGYNFDIPILIDTKTTIAKVGTEKGGSISRRLQINFMENLLSTYERIERSFMMTVYELHKAFNFRTLWEGNDPLAEFRRVARESASGTGRLNGMIQLSNVLTKVEDLETKAVKCFTTNRYSTGIKKWAFSKAQNTAMFESLSKGYTKFSLDIDQSCDSCYNVRLLKLYVELTGPSQPTNVPSTVHLKIRHLSASYFRAGDNKIKEYRQALESYRNIKFDRLTISDATKCEQQKAGGNRQSSFCVNEGDTRLQPMCSSPLNGGKARDRLLGEEECKSPFGTYELMIPVDKRLTCSNTGIQTKNCKDLDLTKFTGMNVWASYFLWSGKAYPKGPDDPICKSPRERKSTG